MSDYSAKKNDYMAEVKERWGDTPEYRDFEGRQAATEMQQILANEMMAIFGEFGSIKNLSPDSQIAQSLVEKLQNFITGHFYRCTDEMLGSLGEMYVTDERFKKNIDDYAGDGTAEFVSKAIKAYCKSPR